MTTFYLVRHAEKVADPDELTGRRPGVVLSAHGKKQAEQLAERLAGVGLKKIRCSPRERAQQTAEPIARRAGVPIEVSAALEELDFGEWTGRRSASLAGDQTWLGFNMRRSVTRIPGGEWFHEVQARVVGEMLNLREAIPEGAAALISHGDVIKAAVLHFLGMPLDSWNRFEVGVASICVIEMDTALARVMKLNEEVDGAKR